MKNKKFLIIGIISAVSIIAVISTIILSNKEGTSGYKGGSYDKPYIPKGFEHTEGTIDEGYVIKHTATGNEFVWVPVDGKNVIYDTHHGDYFYFEENDDGLEESVNTYGGFYIARYEAGCEKSDMGDEEVSQELDALSKPDLNVYNWISQPNAVARAKEMATKQGFEGVQTRLISMKAWDTTIKWLGTQGVDVKNAHKEYGNFAGNMQKTGSNEEWCQCNIYDLAGNANEWVSTMYTGGASDVSHYCYMMHRRY